VEIRRPEEHATDRTASFVPTPPPDLAADVPARRLSSHPSLGELHPDPLLLLRQFS